MILVTGVSSSPGWGIAAALKGAGLDVLGVYNQHPVEGVEAVRHDLLKDPAGLARAYKPSVLIHAAAVGNVDLCEEDRAYCWRFNVEAARALMREAYRAGARLIYVSTDYVFPGDRGLYREEDVPRPINFYGLTKLVAEEAALALGGSVVRISAVFGPGPGRPNFAKVVYQRLSQGQPVEAAADQYLSPTYNLALGRALAALLGRDFSVLHAAGRRMSRLEFALAAARAFGLDGSLIRPTSMDKIPYRAPRPRDSSLDSSKAEALTGVPLSDVEGHLRDYAKYLKAGG